MRKFLKSLGFAMCRLPGAGRPSRGVPVLTFHSVDPSGSYISTDPSLFGVAMARLAERGIRGIGIRALAEQMRSGADPGSVVVLTFDDGLTSFGETAWPILRQCGHQATLYVPVDYVGGMATWYSGYRLPPMPLHTWEHLRKLRDEGVDIQSHGCGHPRLTTLDNGALHQELARSREVLQRELAEDVKHFCYPFGDNNQQVRAEARACGYETAVTTDPGWWSEECDPLAIPRNCLDAVRLDDAAFARRVMDACLDGSYARYIQLRDRWRARTGQQWEPSDET